MKLVVLFKKMGILIALAIMIGLHFPQTGYAQIEEKYFEETGHWVKGVFLKYFNANGDLEVFGYPITEPFVDQGILVQYFQKARIEWHPDNPDPYKVQLGLLGDELKYRDPAINPPASRSRRKIYYPETGHTIAYAFLDFFKAEGGINIFGYPITEMHFEDGKIVQYYQRLKMEWHPDDPTSEVKIGNLGEIYINAYHERIPPDALRPAENTTIDRPLPTNVPEVTNIRAVVSLRYSVMSQKGNQIVSVLVTDNNGDPLPNAQVTIRFEETNKDALPSGTQVLLTDHRGFVQDSIPVSGGRSGTQIIVQAEVVYGQLNTTAQNVFLLWW